MTAQGLTGALGGTRSEQQDGVHVHGWLLELLTPLCRDNSEHGQGGFLGRKGSEQVAGVQGLCWVPEARELGFLFVEASPFLPLCMVCLECRDLSSPFTLSLGLHQEGVHRGGPGVLGGELKLLFSFGTAQAGRGQR